MVAASFPNLSLENPPGTGPTLVSGAEEPFSITDGGVLSLEFAGVTETVVFLASDFVDISAATAQEVADLITLRVDDLVASDDGGYVRLNSEITGEDVSLRVLANGVNAELSFSTVEVTGETYAGGAPNGWAVTTDTYLVNEHAEFSDENGRPEEVFDAAGWGAAFTPDTEAALFDLDTIPDPVESFDGWAPTGVLTSVPTVQGQFDSGPVQNFEDFEEGWGAPLYAAFLPVHLEDGLTESFETGWNQGAGALSGAATFDDGLEAHEDFDNYIPYTIIAEVVRAVGGDWFVTVNGTTYYTTMGGGESEDATATAIASLIDGHQGVSAVGVLHTILVTPDDYDAPLVITIAPPTGGAADVSAAKDYPDSSENWTGNDFNPDFD